MITTSYHGVLERAFAERGMRFDVLIYQNVQNVGQPGKFLHRSWEGAETIVAEPNSYLLPGPDSRTVIVKIHGSLDGSGRGGTAS